MESEKLAAGIKPASGDKAGDKSEETEQEKDIREKREGILEPKPPESLQKLLWMLKHGRKYWKLIVLFILILLIFGVFKYLYPF